MSDLISRQAVLDMTNGWTYNFCDPEDEWAALKEIRELPSAEPEPNEYAQGYNDAKREIALSGEYERAYQRGKEDAEPERKKGRWIEDAESFYKAVNEKGGGVDENTPYFTDDIACSECLAKFSVIDNETERFNFCPNCGARME